MLSIRLTRMGAKKRPFYRVVVAEKSAKRDGRFVEILGHYDPISTPPVVKIDVDRYEHWIANGAQPTDSVRRCLRTQQKAEKTAETAG